MTGFPHLDIPTVLHEHAAEERSVPKGQCQDVMIRVC